MSDLRKAAEMALETLCVGANDVVPNDIDERFEQAIQALRQALAQPEQEPVAYVTIEPAIDGDWRKCPSIKWFNKPTDGPLYTAPPKREWVGLTDEEIEECKISGGLPHAINWRISVKVMQAKLKEKNT